MRTRITVLAIVAIVTANEAREYFEEESVWEVFDQ